MIIRSLEFVASFPKHTGMMKDEIPEFAFIGRSNVGKSSLINMLAGTAGVAKVSQTPGKTQLINAFIVNKSHRWIDLPGYGYAKTSKANRRSWSKMIENYLTNRENLCCIFILIDSRLTPQKLDLDFIEWCAETEIPFALVFTKIDKINQKELSDNKKVFLAEMTEMFTELPTYFNSSAVRRTGREEILKFIEGIVKNFKEHLV